MSRWLIVFFVLFHGKISHAEKDDCHAHLVDPTIRVVEIWNRPSEIATKTTAVLNGVLVWEVGDFFAKKKRLPTVVELSDKLKKYKKNGIDASEWGDRLEKGGDLVSIEAAFLIALQRLPEKFTKFRTETWNIAGEFYARHLRVPSLAEIAQETTWGGSIAQKTRVVESFLGGQDMLSQIRASDTGLMVGISKKLIEAFVRAMAQRDVPKVNRRVPTRPGLGEILNALVRSKPNAVLQLDVLSGKFTTEDLKAVIDDVFGGMDQLENMAKLEKVAQFSGYRSPRFVSKDPMVQLVDQIEQKGGFLITSVNAGVPLELNQLRTMLKYAEDRDFPIVVNPTGQIFENIPPELLENPRIFVLSHSISNRYMNISNIPILPKNQNPFSSLGKRKQFLPGQMIFVGSPQILHMVLPTNSNHIRSTELWSTGSLSRNLYPYAMPVQGRTSYLAKNFHKNGFLVVEKSDREAGIDGRGVQNFWHVRPVYYTNHPDDEVDGFTDLGTRYFVSRGDKEGRVQVSQYDPIILVRGDRHDWITDQRYNLAYKNLLERFSGIKKVIDHDSLEGMAFNHWLDEKPSALAQRFASGELSILREFSGLVAGDNAMLAIRPDLEISHVDANHPRWLRTLLGSSEHPQYQDILNDKILTELKMADRIYGIPDPMEWFLNHRDAWIDSLPARIRREYEETSLRMLDPDRVQVLRPGQALPFGPPHRQNSLENHGDRGANGGRPSRAVKSAGSDGGITGHTHSEAIEGDWFDVGASISPVQDYNVGGYSSATNASAIGYADGTKQLLTYRSATGTIYQRVGKGFLPPEQFFGESRLSVMDNDNDILPEGGIYDQNSEWLKRTGQLHKTR